MDNFLHRIGSLTTFESFLFSANQPVDSTGGADAGLLLLCTAMVTFAAVVLLVAAWFSSQHKEREEVFTRFVQQQRKQLDGLMNGIVDPLGSWWGVASPFSSEFDELHFSTVDIRNAQRTNVTHFCFLVHGFRGTSRDLGYVLSAMTNAGQQLVEQQPCRLVIHSASCNEKKTDDGVAAGGERLMDEMIATIRERMQDSDQPTNRDGLQDITISMLGNSLGGLYARYSLSALKKRCRASCRNPAYHQERSPRLILDDAYLLHLNHFCTTATPHLGVASHTFLPLPRRAEIGVAHAMGQSGKDLFRVNGLLHTMATDDRFMEPLAGFRKRTAYANAYGTDFPVPAATAAFLHANSSYPHHVVETSISSLLFNSDADGMERLDKAFCDDGEKKLVIATLETPAQPNRRAAISKKSMADDVDTLEAELALMSLSLDSLGWKKVFVDMRKEVPRIVVPKSLVKVKLRRRSNSDTEDTSSESSTSSDRSSEAETSSANTTTTTKNTTTVSSKDVAAAVTALPDVVGLYWPLGHNMIVAFSRSRWSTYMNKAGRPVVDGLAKELVDDIFAWRSPDNSTCKDK
jgi:Putative serine esterase (DUF676)